MARRGENIYKRKDGRWEGRYISSRDLNGKARYTSVYGKTYSEVKGKLKMSISDQNNNGHSTENPFMSELFELWLEKQRIGIKESTYSRYHYLINSRLKPAFAHITIGRLTTIQVDQYLLELSRNGRLDGNGGLSAKTVNDLLNIIKSTIKHAETIGCTTCCNLSQVHVKQESSEMRVLSVQEQQRLTCTLLNDTSCINLGILISLYTGIRIGELCALRWSDVDLNESVFYVRKTLQRIRNVSNNDDSKTRIAITCPKSSCSVRQIPIPGFLMDIALKNKSSEEAFLLTGKADSFIEPRTLQNYFKRVLVESNIADANFHSLRHTFATRCVEAGFEIKTLSEILGHSSTSITLNRYVHSSIESKKENMSKIRLIM